MQKFSLLWVFLQRHSANVNVTQASDWWAFYCHTTNCYWQKNCVLCNMIDWVYTTSVTVNRVTRRFGFGRLDVLDKIAHFFKSSPKSLQAKKWKNISNKALIKSPKYLHQAWSRLRNCHRKPIRIDSKSIRFRLESIRDEIRKSRNITENVDSISDFIYACFQKNRCYFDIIEI